MATIPSVKELRETCKNKNIKLPSVYIKKHELIKICDSDIPLIRCFESEKNKKACIKVIYNKRIKIGDINPICKGKAVASIDVNGRMIGIVDNKGNVKPLNIDIKSPSVKILPRLLFSSKEDKLSLLEELILKKSKKDFVNKKCILDQIKKGEIVLKKIEKSAKLNKTNDDLLKEHVKNPKLKKIDLEEIRKIRKQAAIKREIMDNPLLADIRRKPSLKKMTDCDYGFIWDPKTKKCIPVSV